MSLAYRTGVNLREFAYYGTPGIPLTRPDLQPAQLNELRGMGVQLIRLFGVSRRFSAADSARRLRAALDLIWRANMQAIIALNDSFESEWTLAGESAYHTGPLGHLVKTYWLNRLYRLHYLPAVQQIVGALVGHPAVFMWELGNEFAIHPQPAFPADERAFFNFAAETSAAIKQIAPVTLVSTGLVNTNHVTTPRTRADAARRLYGLKTIDAVSLHFYEQDREEAFTALDVDVARALGKPFYVGEMGADIKIGDRSPYYAAKLDQWRAAGAFTVMPWGFDTSPKDVGVSDTRAFARIHADFAAIRTHVVRHATNAPPYRPLPPNARRFRVVLAPLSVRAAPSITSPRLELLQQGWELDVDADSRTQAGGYVWWRHFGKAQWTAERRDLDNVTYMQAMTV